MTKIPALLKSMKTHSYVLQYFIAIFPIFLVIGILGQITMLSKYNAISFFSWGQILSDTAVLFPQFMVLILGVLSAYFYYGVETSKSEKWWSSIILLGFFIIVGLVNYLLLNNSYFYAFMLSFFLGYISYVINIVVGDSGKKQGKYINYIIPLSFKTLILLIIFIIGWTLNYFYSFLYKNIDIKIQDKNYEVNYMNDKYIFYSSGSEIKIIPNDGKNEFIIKDIITTKED